ncbi:MAG: PDZ domain-containing protein [Clostridiales bacterium]|nr:PDZ domain-containing protein [Clostridiales bacterium]
MRRRWGWAAAAVLLLLLAGLSLGLRRDTPRPAETSSAALGLMLLEKEQGLYVLAVTQGTAADRADVHPGDMVIASGDSQATGLAWLDALLSSGQEAIPLTVQRNGKELHLLLPIR